MIGRTILHYEIVDQIGQGGMGVVYRARDLRLDRFVALKLLHPDQAHNPERRRRFIREARAASSLNHPGIVTIYDIDQVDGTDVIAMEYVSGWGLETLIGGKGMRAESAVQYAIQIAAALDKAHAAGILHRDLKPGNIMVNSDGNVKILDFGLAKFVSSPEHAGDATRSAAITREGVIAGTLAYMSPEQARGEIIDIRSDIFSFGVVLFEMLTGIRPFTGSNALATVQQIVAAAPPSLRELKPDVPAGLVAIVHRALEKDRDRRYQRMSEMVAALRALGFSSEAPSTPPQSVTETVQWDPALASGPILSRQWRPYVLLPALLVLVVLAGLLAWSFLPADGTPPAGQPLSIPLTARDHYLRGEALLERYYLPNNIDRAIEEFQSALRLDPNQALAHAGLSRAYLRRQWANPDPQWLRLALSHGREAVAGNEHLAAAHVALGAAHSQAGDHQEAEAELQRALELDPNNAEAHRRLGIDYALSGDNKRALAELKRAAALAPDDAEVQLSLGTAHYRLGDYQESVRYFDEAARLAPDNAGAYLRVAAAYHMLDRFPEAAAALQKALEIQPSASAFTNLGTLLFFEGRYSESVSAFQNAIEHGANGYLNWGNLADALRWTSGREEEAKEAYIRATQLVRLHLADDAGDDEARALLAVYLAKQNKPDEALAEVDRLRKSGKLLPGVLFQLALATEIAGNRQAALDLLSGAMHNGYSAAEVRNEPELATLRQDPAYHRLMARIPGQPR